MTTQADGTKPMDLKEIQPCALCRKGVLHTGNPVFYELTFGSCVADARAIQQIHGLELMMGGARALAPVFAPSTTVAHRLPVSRHLICMDCASSTHTLPMRFLGEEEDSEDGQ